MQSRFDGVSMRYSVDDPSAPSARKTQFYSMLGSRGIWHDGWKAVTTHPTLSGWSDFNDDTWELYHTDTDRAELHDLAAEHPDKLRELVNLWFAEAGDNAGFPLDDRSAVEIITTPRPQLASPRDRYVYFPGTAEVPEAQAVNVRNRSYTIGALVDIPAPGAQGVLFAHGSRFGGHALYVKDNRLHYVYNFVGMMEQKIDATEDLPTGENLILSASFGKDGEDPPTCPPGSCPCTTGTRRSARAASRPSPGCSPWQARACAWAATAANPSPATTRALTRTPSRAAPSSVSPWTSAAIPTSTSSARPRPCSPASSGGTSRWRLGHELREPGALMSRVIAWADRVQQRHSVFGFPYAVIKKYGDDDGGREAALITYYGFLSIFPLLLLGVAILSRVLAAHPDLRQQLISATVPEALQSTVEKSAASLPTLTIPFVAGLIGLLFSGTGVVFPRTRRSTTSPPSRGASAPGSSPGMSACSSCWRCCCSGRWRSAR